METKVNKINKTISALNFVNWWLQIASIHIHRLIVVANKWVIRRLTKKVTVEAITTKDWTNSKITLKDKTIRDKNE